MKLKEWKIQNNLTNRQLAELLGTTAGNVNHLLNRDRGPSLKACLRIIEATKGQVTLADLRPEIAQVS